MIASIKFISRIIGFKRETFMQGFIISKYNRNTLLSNNGLFIINQKMKYYLESLKNIKFKLMFQ